MTSESLTQEQPTLDSHHHFFDPARRRYAWMEGAYAALAHPFGEPEYRRSLGDFHRLGVTVRASVIVQATHDHGETLDLLAAAATAPRPTGVIGWIDLTGADAGERLAELRDSAHGSHLAGLRHQAHDEADPAWLLQPTVARGLTAVSRAGLPFDLLVRSRELDSAIELARRLPELTLVLDHCGKPPLRDGELSQWRRQISDLARSPNVVCKVSGLATEADWRSGSGQAQATALAAVRDSFGPGRLLYGSDWPVCTLAGAPARQLATYLERLDLPPRDRDAFLYGNAARVYAVTGHGERT